MTYPHGVPSLLSPEQRVAMEPPRTHQQEAPRMARNVLSRPMRVLGTAIGLSLGLSFFWWQHGTDDTILFALGQATAFGALWIGGAFRDDPQ